MHKMNVTISINADRERLHSGRREECRREDERERDNLQVCCRQRGPVGPAPPRIFHMEEFDRGMCWAFWTIKEQYLPSQLVSHPRVLCLDVKAFGFGTRPVQENIMTSHGVEHGGKTNVTANKTLGFIQIKQILKMFF